MFEFINCFASNVLPLNGFALCHIILLILHTLLEVKDQVLAPKLDIEGLDSLLVVLFNDIRFFLIVGHPMHIVCISSVEIPRNSLIVVVIVLVIFPLFFDLLILLVSAMSHIVGLLG